ncbi:MAG TPA: MSMEG_4193 family putative phosphomutase [Actinomycetota bacterium]|nr:MSMEG_4193 family putative phosphomutase [Actinomycetota bacterium]
MTTLWLVRHAVTSHTGKKLSGWLEGIDLSEEGHQQAEAAAEVLAKIPLEAVYASPLERTVQTARAIARTHRLSVRVARDLGEVQYGKWTNRSMKVLARTKLWTKVQQWPSGARFPDGESLREVQARAIVAVEQLVEEHPRQHICCVSHGDVIRLLMAHYLGVHMDLFQRIAIAPGAISSVAIGERGPIVLAMNVVPSMFVRSPAEVEEEE